MTRLIGILAAVLIAVSAGSAVAAEIDPPLITATKNGNVTEVTRLLKNGADPDAHDSVRNTALIFAARDGRLEIAERLIAHGASVDWIDAERVTALILAAYKNHPAIARLLLKHGANTEVRDQWNRTALDYAQRRGKDDAIARMLTAAR